MWILVHANGMNGARRVVSFKMKGGEVIGVDQLTNQLDQRLGDNRNSSKPSNIFRQSQSQRENHKRVTS